MSGVRERLEKIIAEKGTRLCFSADLEDPQELLIMLEQVADYIAVVKIHYDILKFNEKVMREWRFIESLNMLKERHNFMVMEDRKLFDISYIIERQWKRFSGWVDLVTVHGFVNEEVLKVLPDVGVLLVCNMSNNDYDITERCKEFRERNDNVVGFITQNKVEGVMCFTPGISLTAGVDSDQKYRSLEDISSKPDIFIVGRGIYKAADPKVAAETLKNVYFS